MFHLIHLIHGGVSYQHHCQFYIYIVPLLGHSDLQSLNPGTGKVNPFDRRHRQPEIVETISELRVSLEFNKSIT